MKKHAAALLLLFSVSSLASAQEHDVLVTGGWLFASTSNARVRNPGILIRAGKILRVGGDLSMAAADAERVQVADTVVPRGNPLQDIKRVRDPRVVIKAGRVYDPEALLKSAAGKIGPASAADTGAWAPTPRTGRRGAPGSSGQ